MSLGLEPRSRGLIVLGTQELDLLRNERDPPQTGRPDLRHQVVAIDHNDVQVALHEPWKQQIRFAVVEADLDVAEPPAKPERSAPRPRWRSGNSPVLAAPEFPWRSHGPPPPGWPGPRGSPPHVRSTAAPRPWDGCRALRARTASTHCRPPTHSSAATPPIRYNPTAGPLRRTSPLGARPTGSSGVAGSAPARGYCRPPTSVALSRRRQGQSMRRGVVSLVASVSGPATLKLFKPVAYGGSPLRNSSMM